ncbi:MAG: hypothetical protein P4L38_02385 [Syntrophaceae bacterium]|nr:hypothetical protein [Syntrophaceae bacterium]
MTKIAILWSGFLERIRGSKTNRNSGKPYKDMPVIPSHKAVNNPGFSVVLINERRGPRQFNLTGKRFRLGLVGSVIIVCLSVFGVYSVFRGLVGHTSIMAGGYKKGVADIASVQSKTQDQETSFSGPSKDYSGSAGSGGQRSGSTYQEAEADHSTKLLQSSEKLEGDLSAGLRQPQESTQENQTSNVTAALDHNGTGNPESSARSQTVAPQHDQPAGPIVNFNAQDVTVKPTGAKSGTLSFRLIKDHSDVLFSGYLFVFVEMKDKRGETKIYVYPDKTRLGEGDLPSNFKQGENISFKYNSRVELPYGDIRSGAGLARVSILLYGDDGKIVFQRGFEKKELLVSGPSGPQRMEGAKSKPTEKRRAL